MVDVELIYIPMGQDSIHRRLSLADGATVLDVLQNSGLYTSHPEVKQMAVGIFSTVVSLDRLVKSGDRVEIYRPLLIDPKEKRRQRARLKS